VPKIQVESLLGCGGNQWQLKEVIKVKGAARQRWGVEKKWP